MRSRVAEPIYRRLLSDLKTEGASAAQELTLFTGLQGRNFGGLAVVGRAVNGWTSRWTTNDLSRAAAIDSVLDTAYMMAEKAGPLQWVEDRWGDTTQYNSKRSAFWRTARSLALNLAPNAGSDG